MHAHDLSRWSHQHDYSQGHERESERRTALVVAITGVMMVIEIACGWLFNSMALLADGWHMATHTLALGVGVAAYRYARIHAQNPAFSFGTGKIHALGGYTSALFLAFVAVGVLVESVRSLYQPHAIDYNEALIVAVVGLLVNLASVKLLQHDHGHSHGHDHDHNHAHADAHDRPHTHDDAHEHDINRKAAYAHVVVDAMTSVFAIVALLLGKYMGWAMMDPIVGIVGAIIIGQWSYGLLKTAMGTLLDRQPETLLAPIRTAIEGDGDSEVADLHIWQVAPGKMAAILSIVTHTPRTIDEYKTRLHPFGLAHITVELNQCSGR